MNQRERERREIIFWKNSIYENPNHFSVQNLTNKMAEARVFMNQLDKFEKLFSTATNVLEIGAGQGWASALLKKIYPDKRIYCSDISKYAVQSAKYWEKLFEVKIDKKIVCKSTAIPFKHPRFDLVFCFQSAHHFVNHEKTLSEIFRVLVQGGTCLYLNEPSCKKYFYSLAKKRVNKKRPIVYEDLLIPEEMSKAAAAAGFQKVKLHLDPTLVNRGPAEMFYYLVLRRVPLLKKLLPCTANYLFSK